LLAEFRRLEDKVDLRLGAVEEKVSVCIGGVERTLDTRLDAMDQKLGLMDQKLDLFRKELFAEIRAAMNR